MGALCTLGPRVSLRWVFRGGGQVGFSLGSRSRRFGEGLGTRQTRGTTATETGGVGAQPAGTGQSLTVPLAGGRPPVP